VLAPGRAGFPVEIANAALWLASSESISRLRLATHEEDINRFSSSGLVLTVRRMSCGTARPGRRRQKGSVKNGTKLRASTVPRMCLASCSTRPRGRRRPRSAGGEEIEDDDEDEDDYEGENAEIS
jgi:hypothetical protein